MFRPDSGLFVAAVGFTLAIVGLYRTITQWRNAQVAAGDLSPRQIIARTFASGIMLTVGFAAALAPWTARNAHVFGVFQPIAPAQANMPDEFVPRGYIQWLKTWVDDVKYTDTLEWSLDDRPIRIEQVPYYAFDSPEERVRIAALLERYNNPASAIPQQAAALPPETTTQAANPNSENQAEAAEPDEQSAEEADTPEGSEPDAPEEVEEPKIPVEMTPDIDAGFADVARERIARHPLRYYLIVPLKRASSLWFDTHSQYYPFQGELLPFAALDANIHQQYWLPAFTLLTLLYTAVGFAGAWLMWRCKQSRRYLLMLVLLIIPRLAFLSTIENPEPRYVVEFFAFVIAAGSLAMIALWDLLASRMKT